MSGATTSYEYLQTEVLAPGWFRGPWGSAFQAVLGIAKDILTGAGKDAVKARLVQLAPAGALPYLGVDRSIERYPGESDSDYRARLASAWDVWEFAGTSRGILAALRAAGYTGSLAVYSELAAPPWYAGAWPPNGPDTFPLSDWARFWVELTPPVPGNYVPRYWGNANSWGDGGTWGSSASAEHIALIRSIIRKWKPAHERCAEIFVRLPDGLGGWHTLRWPGV